MMRRTLLIGFALVVFSVVVLDRLYNRRPHVIVLPAQSAIRGSETAATNTTGTEPQLSGWTTNGGKPIRASAPSSGQGPQSTFKAFSSWADQYLADDPAASAAQGEALAWQRRQALLHLIETDPAQAILLAVPFHWRLELPANVTRHFEQWVDGRGVLEVAMAENFDTHLTTVYRWAVIGGQRYDAFVYGQRLAQVSHTNIPLHGIAIDRKLALLSEPMRVLASAEADALERARGRAAPQRCAVCDQPGSSGREPIEADIGGETVRFCGVEHLRLATQHWVQAESPDSGDAQANDAVGGGSSWTQGRKTLLYMRVNFPDDLTEPNSEADAYSAMDVVNAFYVENSYDTTWLTTTVTPLLTVPRIKAWYSTAGPGPLLDDAREVARKAGFDTRNYNLDIVSHTSVPGFNWGGLGAVQGKGTWLQSHGAGVTAHELGHNYGLPHANFWDTTEHQFSAIGPGTNVEYGNIFDTMGAASAGNNHFGALFKNALRWLPDTVIHNVTTSGVYRIHPFDGAQRVNDRFYAARVRKDFDRDYWLEFRGRFTGNTSLQNGLSLYWSPWRKTGGTSLIDATPWTAGLNDSPVVIGRTFSDDLAGVHITPIARGGAGEDSWIEVQINLGGPTPDLPCCLDVEVDPTNATPGQWVRFHATVADRDDEAFAYAWEFDDGTFSTNNRPWAHHGWTKSGDHVVRCVVSDMRGGTASANVVVTVGEPSGFRVSGTVLDPHGDPVKGVRMQDAFALATGGFPSLTDSRGRFVMVGLDSFVMLEPTQYGYDFTNATWQNPVFLDTDFLEADFIALPLTNVSLTLGTNLLSESNATEHQLTLTRTGSTNEDLGLILYVSGSAGLGSDLDFSPSLNSGSNEVVIAAGTSSLTFTFTAVNNSVVEGTEETTVTILDDPGYVLAPLAEARITILDDDQPARPEVSIEPLVDFVPESGFDEGVFVVSRTGSTMGDLPVFYSAGGTATSGTDYPTLIGVVVIPAGSSSARIKFRPLDDKDVEPDETVTVDLTPNATYSINEASATATIIDDDILVVTISPTGMDMAEPSSIGQFTVKRDGDQTGNLVVYYTVSGTASNGVDFVSPSGAATIPAGETSADIFLNPLDDGLTEGDESVTLTLMGNPGYDVGTPASATLDIRDDERVTVSVTAPNAATSEPGGGFGSFKISRGSVVNGLMQVNLAINGTAIPGADYVPLNAVVAIPDGASSVTLDVIPFDDLHVEPVEDVIITLLPGTNYNVDSPAQARVSIVDDDFYSVPAVGFTAGNSGAPESESPGLAVSLSSTSTEPVTVSYKVIGGTASAADYSPGPGVLTFTPGQWAKSLPLTITDDTEVEPDETIVVTLYDPANATHDGIKIHTYTIVDDDLSSVSVSATASHASETGPEPGNFRITRSDSTNSSLLVNFQITGTASAPGDFAPLGTVATLPAGVTFLDLPVDPVNDGTVELDESVVLTLISAPGANLVSPHQATITISDDDPDSLPVVTIASTNAPHAVEGGSNGAFVFTRSGSTNSPLTLPLGYAGTASRGADYASLPDFVTIPAGQSSFVLSVAAMDDSLIEGEETVVATLTMGDTYRVSHPATAIVTIQDNDQNVRVDASDLFASEPGTDLGGFTFTRFGTTNTDLEVFLTVSGTAVNGGDYVLVSNSFVIPAGCPAATLPIKPLDDFIVEGAEKVTLTLQSSAAYTLANPTTATVTILDDEPMLSLLVNSTNVIEGSQVPAVLTVWRGGNPDYEFTAHLEFGGSAAYGADYPPIESNVFFNCGILAIDLPMYPTNELAVEGSETLTAAIVPDPGYTTLTPSNAATTIVDAGTNHAPEVVITSPTADEIFLLDTNVNIILESTVVDDGDTNTPITLTWTNLSGPDSFYFGNMDQTNTTASFTNGGVYVLRLIADDGQLIAFADVTVVVDTLARLSNNLVHWTFDERNGTNVLDVSGNGYDGVIAGTPDWGTTGVLGGALGLDGLGTFVREAGDSGLLNGRKQFSLSCWLKTTTTNSSQGIFTADEGGLSPTLTLSGRRAASCGSATNVFESTLATSCGEARQVSGSDQITNDWQHIALTWSNGLAPSLYLNGVLDQPNRHKVALQGLLVNCPQFILGKGPPDAFNTRKGWVDDLRVFPRALSAVEVAGLVATNYGAMVEVPTNLIVQVLTPVELSGLVTDDGRPIPPGMVTITWSQISGPLDIAIPHPNDLTNTVEFTQSGDYMFRLIADDGQVKVFQDLPVTVVEPTLIYAYASDSYAAELGPDPGELAISRYGDLNFELTVFFNLSGTASNGADVVFIPQTNEVTFPLGTDYLTIPVTPFLDHRTEGDETLTLTVVSNLTYTIGSGEATVLIQDSPYGMWNIEHFTLEELTDPALSGEEANFDQDTLVNFAEYALSREPKSPETNSPLQTAIELSPSDGLNHINISYHRRLMPTDVAYAVNVSKDLITWHAGPEFVEEFQVIDDGNGLTETVMARLVTAWPTSTPQFITVRVWLLSTGP